MPDSALIEAFSSRLRNERLNTHCFLSLEDACETLDRWNKLYNEKSPHSAIGNISPIMLINPTGAITPAAQARRKILDPSVPDFRNQVYSAYSSCDAPPA